eukprot:m.248400 g.248400  ORF g.248400 m.248400 type:complete len:138 (-) comp15717_c0_seq1:119-532(-)
MSWVTRAALLAVALGLLAKKQYLPLAFFVIFVVVYHFSASRSPPALSRQENVVKLRRMFPEVPETAIIRELERSTSLEEATTNIQRLAPTPSSSSAPASPASLPSFGSFQERKEQMIADARREYLAKHGGVVPKIVI